MISYTLLSLGVPVQASLLLFSSNNSHQASPPATSMTKPASKDDSAINGGGASNPVVNTTTTVGGSTSSTLVQDPSNECWQSQIAGERLTIPEWEDVDGYRSQNGWKGRDFVHDAHAPVRISEYYLQTGSDSGGGTDTVLTGIVEFTDRAESHGGYCHGGSMCSVMDDVVGWTAFCVTGKCRPWTGFTVQVNTSLTKPVPVGSVLQIRASISKMERRKVSVTAILSDPSVPDKDHQVHARCEGLVVLNKGVLPET